MELMGSLRRTTFTGEQSFPESACDRQQDFELHFEMRSPRNSDDPNRGCCNVETSILSSWETAAEFLIFSDDVIDREWIESNSFKPAEQSSGKQGDSRKKKCWEKDTGPPVSVGTMPNMSMEDFDLPAPCCGNDRDDMKIEVAGSELKTWIGDDMHSLSPASCSLQASDSTSKSAFTSDPGQVDVERDLFGIQRVTLQVQGMSCTGCEKKLFKLLNSLPEISSVKTSLLLAQAEFNLRPSNFIDAENIASNLQRMTGFTCTKIVDFGVDLELIIEDNPQHYADLWPASIINLAFVNKNRIRVSYHPKAIGARELLSDPFFQHVRLAPPSPPPLIASGRVHLWKSFYMTLFSCILTIPVLILAWAQLPKRDIIYGAISLVLATVVQFVVVGPIYVSAVKSLIFSRTVEMDFLVVLSTTAAYVYSIIAYAYLANGMPLVEGEFFETSTLLVTLILIGRTASSFARQRAVESITIESLQTTTAIIIDKDGKEMEIDTRLLQYRDVFKVLPDMTVVTDGVVLTGESELDESLLTGESALLRKGPGSSVIAGSINHSGSLEVQVTRLPCENTIKTISSMVDKAKSSKPNVQALANRVASYFIPVIVGITVMVFIAWGLVGMIVRNQSASTACITAMTYAISVLIISCPCAIGLAVPMVVVVAGGVGAQQGIIFKTAETIDTARKVTHVIFDKTGTLTQGKLQVTAQEYLSAGSTYGPSLVLSITANSTHPVSMAITAHLRAAMVKPLVISKTVSFPGKGTEAYWNGSIIRAGNPYWLSASEDPLVSPLLSSGQTVFCVTLDTNLVAVYALRDSLRPEALRTINDLRKREIEISLLSGDNDSSVHAVAAELGIEASNVRARCTPAQKQEYVKSKLMSYPHHPPDYFRFPGIRNKKKREIIIFCGDGTNDAPSLAQASIGVHMANHTGTHVSGTSSPHSMNQIASSAADAVLMRPSLSCIITMMDLSQAFHRHVVFNFIWCFVYNLFAVLLAAGAFTFLREGEGVRIKPEWAGLGEFVSILPVVAVSSGLRWKKF
jgi:Cu2+-exporting ATPase